MKCLSFISASVIQTGMMAANKKEIISYDFLEQKVWTKLLSY